MFDSCRMPLGIASVGLILLVSEGLLSQSKAQTLPPPEDTPEEILLTEIITEARSPLDGQPLTAAEYAELQDRLRLGPGEITPRLAPKVIKGVELLRLRKLIKSILPFL